MFIRAIYIQALLLLLSAHLYAGSNSYCSNSRKNLKHYAKNTTADTAENNYDVKHVKFDLNLTNTSVYVSGNVTTTAQAIANMNNYVFELDSTLTIDSFFFNGAPMPVQTTGPVRRVTISPAINAGSMFSARVVYHGTPPTGNGFFTGLTYAVSNGVQMVYTVSDPFAAKDWWPCKQSLDDKIDSVEMNVTVPVGVVVGSNGLLRSTTTPAPGYTKYQWKTRYAIDYYLISVALAPYLIDSFHMHFTGSPDSMLIENFFYDSITYNAYRANFDSLGLMVDYLSTLYGRYPFYQEKYGICYSTLSGGMEHQTMTTIGVAQTPLIAHELGHQWFGDHVTYSTWGDVWLSEGFATYTEQLYVGHFWSAAAAYNYRTAQYNNVMSSAGGSVYVTGDTTNPNILFNSRLVYNKGAAVVHMLRFMAPQDTLFFTVLKTYQQQHAFGLANTADLKNLAEQVYGRNLDTFFTQWVYGEGYPTYAVKWFQSGGQVYVKLTQTASRPTVTPLFATPLEITLTSAQGDTVVKVYNDQPSQVYSFSWGNTMTGVIIDPNNWILNRVGLIKNDSTFLGTGSLLPGKIKVYPNPSRDYWQVEQLPAFTNLYLVDATGRTVWKGRSNNAVTIVPAYDLAPGNYFLKAAEDMHNTEGLRLIHW